MIKTYIIFLTKDNIYEIVKKNSNILSNVVYHSE